jgi:hypothetical protein
MKTIRHSLGITFIALAFAACAQAERTTVVKAASAGARFDGDGRVSMHPGEPCAPQIMFDLQVATLPKKWVWLAAPMKDSKILTTAARRHARVHVSGVWRRGQERGCSYVNVTQVAPAR